MNAMDGSRAIPKCRAVRMSGAIRKHRATCSSVVAPGAPATRRSPVKSSNYVRRRRVVRRRSPVGTPDLVPRTTAARRRSPGTRGPPSTNADGAIRATTEPAVPIRQQVERRPSVARSVDAKRPSRIAIRAPCRRPVGKPVVPSAPARRRPARRRIAHRLRPVRRPIAHGLRNVRHPVIQLGHRHPHATKRAAPRSHLPTRRCDSPSA